MLYRIIIICLFACPVRAFSGADINVFSDGGFQGLSDTNGNILVPALYEGLGWSDGSVELNGNLIGYLEKGKWGLITTENKQLTAPLYNHLEPFGEKAFLASVQASNSNRLYHGLLDPKGKTLLSFDYFSVEYLCPNRLRVSKYQNGSVLLGVVDMDGNEIIPLQYQQINTLQNMFVCEGGMKMIQLFDMNGVKVYGDWLNKVTEHPEGYLIEKEGKVGLISPTLQLRHQPDYKYIDDEGNPFSMKNWQIFSMVKDEQSTLACDSLAFINDRLWIAHINNVQHMLGASDKLFAHQQYSLKHIQNGFIVAQNIASGQWNLFKTDGTLVEGDFDTIAVEPNYFFCKARQGWVIYNTFNRKVSEKYFTAVGPSNSRNIPVDRNGYWGWLDFQGKQLIAQKYDSIGPGIGKQFTARYVGGWGVSNFQDQWIILPEYDQVTVFENHYLAVKGLATSLLNDKGEVLFKTGMTVDAGEVLKLLEGDKVGVITRNGFVVFPKYKGIKLIDEYYLLENDSTVEMIDSDGRWIVRAEDEIEKIFSFSEGYFHILKDRKHGFVNLDGKLRIANRYDDAKPYSEGVAAIKLREKWGYLNKSEELVIQPYYSDCSPFEEGLAVISMNGHYGIIDRNGRVVIETDYADVRRTLPGNYLLTNSNGKKGLANKNGLILLNSNYDEIIDTEFDVVIARKGKKYGVVTYSGHSHLPFEYKQILVRGDYLLLNQ